ncbi:MAG: hypothetical protein JWO42_1070 [Chloroflexi bacterium]|nr:hypothetical protein [Chloroflexota bacterium]
MNLKYVGQIERANAVLFAIPTPLPGYLILHVMLNHMRRICGIQVDHLRARCQEVWNVEVDSSLTYAYAGHNMAFNAPTAVAIAPHHVFVAGGTRRMVVDISSGTILMEVQAVAPPTGPVVVHGNRVLVPEGQFLAIHERETLQLIDRLAVPGSRWLFTPSAGALFPIQDEEHEHTAIWQYDRNVVWELGVHESLISQPILTPTHAIIPIGGGSPTHIAARDAETGATQWQVGFPRPEPLYPMSDGPSHVRHCGAIRNGNLVTVTALPAVAALNTDSGAVLWNIVLEDATAAFATTNRCAWVSTDSCQLLAVDDRRGTILDSGSVSPDNGRPKHLFPLSLDSGADEVLMITGGGRVYHAEI